jgi:hypothetical protein
VNTPKRAALYLAAALVVGSFILFAGAILVASGMTDSTRLVGFALLLLVYAVAAAAAAAFPD